MLPSWNQVEELPQATVGGVFLGDKITRRKFRFNHLFLRTAGFRFPDGHATVDVFHLFTWSDRSLLQSAAVFAGSVALIPTSCSFPTTFVHRDSGIEPEFRWFRYR